MNVTGTDGNDNLIGTEEGDEIVGKLGHDRISGLGGNDRIEPGPGDDHVWLGSGSDIIVVESDAGRDLIEDFTSGEDTVVFRNFGDIDSFADLEPFMTIREGTRVEIDMSVAAGGTGGDEVLLFNTINGQLGPDDVSFERFPEIDSGATVTPFVPPFPRDPGLYDLKEPESSTLTDYGFTDEGPYVQPFEDPLWGVIH